MARRLSRPQVRLVRKPPRPGPRQLPLKRLRLLLRRRQRRVRGPRLQEDQWPMLAREWRPCCRPRRQLREYVLRGGWRDV